MARRFLPDTIRVPSSQRRSLNFSALTSFARKPSRAINKRMARSLAPSSEAGSHDWMSRSTSLAGRYLGSEASRHLATFKKAHENTGTLINVPAIEAWVPRRFAFRHLATKASECVSIQLAAGQSFGFGPVGEVNDFRDVAANGASSVALVLQPDDEVLQVRLGQSATAPRQSRGIFEVSNQHAEQSACCSPAREALKGRHIMERPSEHPLAKGP